jgi:hypothetical protein
MLTSDYVDPQTIELSQEPQQMGTECWNVLTSSDLSPTITHESLEGPSSITLYGRVYVPIGDQPGMSRTPNHHATYTESGEIIHCGDQTDTLGISMLKNSTLNVVSTDNTPLAENEITKGSTNLHVPRNGPQKNAEKSEPLGTASSPESSSQY